MLSLLKSLSRFSMSIPQVSMVQTLGTFSPQIVKSSTTATMSRSKMLSTSIGALIATSFNHCQDTLIWRSCYLASRYASFFQSLVGSKTMAVRFMARMTASDKCSVLGRTLSHLQISCGLDPHVSEQPRLTQSLMKKKSVYSVIPEYEKWRISMCKELLKLRDNQQVELHGFDPEEIKEMLNYACVSWTLGHIVGFFLWVTVFPPQSQTIQ